MPQAIERLLATPNTTPRLPAISFPPLAIVSLPRKGRRLIGPGALRRKAFCRADRRRRKRLAAVPAGKADRRKGPRLAGLALQGEPGFAAREKRRESRARI